MAKNHAHIFDIRGKGLKLESMEDVAPLLEGYDAEDVKEIYLGGNSLGVGASQSFAAFITKTKQLEVTFENFTCATFALTVVQIADLSNIFVGRLIAEIPIALHAFCTALIPKSTLIDIDLSDNAFGERCVDHSLLDFLEQNHFEILRLNNNGLGPDAGAEIANALRNSSASRKGANRPLKKIICGRNRLEDGSAQAWAKAFEELKTLEEVRMPQNGILMEGIKELAGGLEKCSQLRYLDLQDNTFTNGDTKEGLSAVIAWATSLKSMKDLEVLNISDCFLSHDGEVPEILTEIAKGSNPKLVNLQLQNNNLKSDSTQVLADAISTHLASLIRLGLQRDDVDEDNKLFDTIRQALSNRGGVLVVFDEYGDPEEATEEATEEAIEEAIEEPISSPLSSADVDNLTKLLDSIVL